MSDRDCTGLVSKETDSHWSRWAIKYRPDSSLQINCVRAHPIRWKCRGATAFTSQFFQAGYDLTSLQRPVGARHQIQHVVLSESRPRYRRLELPRQERFTNAFLFPLCAAARLAIL